MKKFSTRSESIWLAGAILIILLGIVAVQSWDVIAPAVAGAWDASLTFVGFKAGQEKWILGFFFPILIALFCLREAGRSSCEDMERMDKESDLMKLLHEASKVNPSKK